MTFFFPLTIVTSRFEDETALAEAFGFAEISRFDHDDERRQWAIRQNAEEILKKAEPLELQSRVAPAEIEQTELRLSIEPARNQKNWRTPVELKFHVLRTARPDGYLQAFVPALGIAVVSKDGKDFDQQIEREIRQTLIRTGAAKSLRELRLLERIAAVTIERQELAVELKTAKQRQLEEDNPDEKSVLDEAATRLLPKNLRAAYQVQTQAELLADVLRGASKPSVLLVGKSGAGKTAVVHEFVRQREKLGFKNTNVYQTSGARLVAGQSGFGMWQERCQKIVAEVRQQRAILYLGNLVELVEVGKSNSNQQGIASFFRPKIQRGELQTIVECTTEQLAVIERLDANLLSAFQQIKIEEPDQEINFKILENVAKEFAGVQISPDALKTLDRVHRRYATYSASPGRPVRFLRNLLDTRNAGEIQTSDVLQTFSEETGLPLFLLSDSEKLDLAKVEIDFNRQVLGQTEAVKTALDLIAVVKAQLTRPRKPIASLLFIGATGVGKTELAKTLAQFFFGSRDRLARFDMSEFSNALAVNRLIGGTGEIEGLLTAKMREQPFSVLLFDEFEKADTQFFDLLLQILGDGRLTDAHGRTADFTNAIIVMTSNLGAATFGRGKSGFVNNSREKAAAVQHFSQAVREFLRPEIFNRLDLVVPFAPLDEATALKITNLEIEKLLRRDGLRFRNVTLNLAPEAVQHLAEIGYDARYGARPLRRAIERELLAPLAAELNLRQIDEQLTVGVQLKNRCLRFEIESNISRKNRLSAEFALAANANRAASLRRKTQKLAASHHLTEIDDERFQLVRIQDRLERKRFVAPEDATRLERLPKIRTFLDQTKNFGGDVARLEDRILLDIYGKTETADQNFAQELIINELRFEQTLFDLLKLKTDKPNEICLTVHGENAPALCRLIRALLQCVEDARIEIAEIYCLTTNQQKDVQPLERPVYGRTVWSVQVKEPENFFAKTQKEVVCAQFKITGERARLLFAAESGVHYFVADNQTSRVAVGAGDFKIKDTQPSAQFATRGSLDDSFFKRRTYNADTKIVDDPVLGKKFEFDGRIIAPTVFQAIQENLLKTANNLIE